MPTQKGHIYTLTYLGDDHTIVLGWSYSVGNSQENL